MTINLAAIATEEGQRPLAVIVNGDGTPTISYLDSLRAPSMPLVRNIAEELLEEFGLTSEVSGKEAETARDKCRRPATLNKYPWFKLSHIRDYLRFRTHLFRASDFEDVLRYFVRLQDEGRISIVKIDSAKLIRPGSFGWRMIAVDMRIAATGMLVEHYMTFRELIEVNEAWLHKVYEAWRSVSTDDMTIEELRAFDRDASFSRHAYRELLFDGILREQPAGSTASARRKDASQAILSALTSMLNLR
jgi:hypothetical protein